jgi:UPF0042 nucleotide-binding protein
MLQDMVKEQAKAIAELADAVRKLQVGDRKRKGDSVAIKLVSFGYNKKGPPRLPVSQIVDARRIHDPEKQCPYGLGIQPDVRDYVVAEAGAWEVMQEIYQKATRSHAARKHSYDPSPVEVWTGCGSGRHRSVAVTEEVGDSLRGEGYQVIIEHQERDSWPRRSRQHRHPIVTEDWENRATDAFPQ